MAGRNLRALTGLAGRLAAGDIDLEPGGDRRAARRSLLAVPGVGPWAVEIIAMRALRDPDCFPVSDSGLRQGAHLLGLPATVPALLSRSERWCPWRFYATQYIWAATDHPINRFPLMSDLTPVGEPGSTGIFPTDNLSESSPHAVPG